MNNDYFILKKLFEFCSIYKLKYHFDCKGNTIFMWDATEKLTESFKEGLCKEHLRFFSFQVCLDETAARYFI